MTDPMNALQSFQEEFLLGNLELKTGVLDPNLYIRFDAPKGEIRVTYARLEGKTVTALVSFAESDPIDGISCYSIGYAVPEEYRKQGRAKEIVIAAISELQHGLAGSGQTVFYVEAVVRADNMASRRVAEQVISKKPTPITEEISGLPAFHYIRKIESPRVA
jgi:RimJ/RimL family protein N-acetyltransferase